MPEEENVKKFKSVIIYPSYNEKINKTIKLVKKIFGSQLKLLFIKEK